MLNSELYRKSTNFPEMSRSVWYSLFRADFHPNDPMVSS